MLQSVDLSEKKQREVYAWVDSLPLSRPKRNISKDFSDGLMFAEVVRQFFPALIDVHNFKAAPTQTLKRSNWSVLAEKVLTHIGLYLNEADVYLLSGAAPLAIEKLLYVLRTQIPSYLGQFGGNKSGNKAADGLPSNHVQSVEVSALQLQAHGADKQIHRHTVAGPGSRGNPKREWRAPLGGGDGPPSFADRPALQPGGAPVGLGGAYSLPTGMDITVTATSEDTAELESRAQSVMGKTAVFQKQMQKGPLYTEGPHMHLVDPSSQNANAGGGCMRPVTPQRNTKGSTPPRPASPVECEALMAAQRDLLCSTQVQLLQHEVALAESCSHEKDRVIASLLRKLDRGRRGGDGYASAMEREVGVRKETVFRGPAEVGRPSGVGRHGGGMGRGWEESSEVAEEEEVDFRGNRMRHRHTLANPSNSRSGRASMGPAVDSSRLNAPRPTTVTAPRHSLAPAAQSRRTTKKSVVETSIVEASEVTRLANLSAEAGEDFHRLKLVLREAEAALLLKDRCLREKTAEVDELEREGADLRERLGRVNGDSRDAIYRTATAGRMAEEEARRDGESVSGSLRRQLCQLERTLETERNRVSMLKSETDKAEQELASANARANAAEADYQRTKQQLRDAERRLNEVQDAEDRVKELETLLANRDRRASNASLDVQRLRDDLKASQTEVEAGRVRLRDLENEVDDLRARRRASGVGGRDASASTLSQLRDREDEVASLRREIADLKASEGGAGRGGEGGTADVSALERKLELKETQVKNQMKKLKEKTDEVDDLKKKIATLEKGGGPGGASSDETKRLEEEKYQLEQELKEARLSLEEAKAAGGGGGGDGSASSTIVQKKLEMKEGQVKKQMDMLKAKNAEIIELKKQVEEAKSASGGSGGGGEEVEKLRQELEEKTKEIETLKSKLADGSGDGGGSPSSGSSGDSSVLQKKLEMKENQVKKQMDMLKAKNEEIAKLKKELEEAKGGGVGGGGTGDEVVDKLKKEIQEKDKEIEELKAKAASGGEGSGSGGGGGDSVLQKKLEMKENQVKKQMDMLKQKTEEIENLKKQVGSGSSSGGGGSDEETKKWRSEAEKKDSEIEALKAQLEVASKLGDASVAASEGGDSLLKKKLELKENQVKKQMDMLKTKNAEIAELKRQVEGGGGAPSGGGESGADVATWKAEAGKLEGEVKKLKEQLEAAKSASGGGGDAAPALPSAAGGDQATLQKKLELKETQVKRQMDMLKEKNAKIANLEAQLKEGGGGGGGGAGEGAGTAGGESELAEVKKKNANLLKAVGSLNDRLAETEKKNKALKQESEEKDREIASLKSKVG
uniref:Calponin-homology (CH) domain-containing protein n=1 Tax=Chromera velia CCMP2878 TaxID=1169474 RepID=A0A0G4GTN7_9ALVE|eukprot:Cvel_23341.t1-p1 / transcript=Cvel_23341.t1 / gene=Cvel_23341 / organism=Chromera_velia_CCMP2878 / gene_product=Sperm flagellar protein 1, putative / transcript_product=Sperm flagellar protein 1, putative / location=Cvel_scaffold2392:18954-25368(-) / protein_length=1316 / sequence_SO=supercontig / SO=protein_coding / is_pseudo=false